jgi:predicted DNA-binding transcriptional regulator
MTKPTDVQAMFDNVPISQKELLWIEGTTKRWDGYTYFAREPAKILAWFERHLPLGKAP